MGRGEGTFRGGADQTVTLPAIFGPKSILKKPDVAYDGSLFNSMSKSLESFPCQGSLMMCLHLYMYEIQVQRLQYHNMKDNE